MRAGRPHPEQKRAPGDSGVPQPEQAVLSREVPQWEQNFPVPGAPQAGHCAADAFMSGDSREEERTKYG